MKEKIDKKLDKLKKLCCKSLIQPQDIESDTDTFYFYKKMSTLDSILFVILTSLLWLFIPRELDDGLMKGIYPLIVFLISFLIIIVFSKKTLEKICAFLINIIGFLFLLGFTISANSFQLQIYLSDNPQMILAYFTFIVILFIAIVYLEILLMFNNKFKIKYKLYLLLLLLSFILIAIVTFLPKLLPYLI